MKQLPSFVHCTFSSHFSHLHKSLYDLKQALRAWYNHLSDYLLSIDFQASKVDTYLFILFVVVIYFICLCMFMIFYLL